MAEEKDGDGHAPKPAPGDGAGASSGSASGSPPRSVKPASKGARWGDPILAADQAWTRFETWLVVVTLGLEVLSMSLWVCLKGFSSPSEYGGVVFRGMVGAIILGTAAHLGLAKQKETVRRGVTVAGVILGFATAKVWGRLGVDYCSNLLNWYQQASFLTLFGGLRGVGTRLTMLLALIGGSLATGRGRHIVIDVITRFVGHRPRMIMVVFGWFATAFACSVAAWGFFDHISIENFGARADDAAGKKIGQVLEQLGEDFFIARKQIALDFKSTPHVLFGGQTYSEWLTGKEWNEWLDSAGFAERYGKEATEGLKIPEDSTRAPLVIIPGRGEPRGELINAAYLVFPIGLLVIAARFIVRCLLVISGHASTESDEVEEWGEVKEEDANV